MVNNNIPTEPGWYWVEPKTWYNNVSNRQIVRVFPGEFSNLMRIYGNEYKNKLVFKVGEMFLEYCVDDQDTFIFLEKVIEPPFKNGQIPGFKWDKKRAIIEYNKNAQKWEDRLCPECGSALEGGPAAEWCKNRPDCDYAWASG